MRKLSPYTCPTCAAILVKNPDKTFGCVYCGNTFESTFLKSNKFEETINSGLEKKSFTKISDMCRDILKEEPDNAMALRNLLLCNLRVYTTFALTMKSVKLREFSDFAEFIDAAPEDCREFFENIEKLCKKRKEVDMLEERIASKKHDVVRDNSRKAEFNKRTTYGILVFLILSFVVLVMSISCYVNNKFETTFDALVALILSFFFFLFTLIAFANGFSDRKEAKRIKGKIKEDEAEVQETEESYKKALEELDVLKARVKELDADLIEKYS